jgi:hypothetical protein
MGRSRWLLLGLVIATVPLAAGGVSAGPTATVPGALAWLAANPLWIVAILGAGALVLAGRARAARVRRDTQTGWSPPGRFEFVPAAGRPAASQWAVSGALSRVEARWLLPGSVAFGVGIGFCILEIVLFGVVFARDHGGEIASLVELLPILIHPLAGMTVLAVYRARTRARRDGLDELFAACPTTAHTRNLGHLRTAWVPTIAAVAFAGILLTTYASTTDVHWGPTGPRQIAHVLGCGVLALGAVALGVAVARWAPWTLAPVIAVVAIGIASVNISTSGDRATDPSRQLSTWLTQADVAVRFTSTHWSAHYVWIVLLVAMTVVVALVRDSRRRVHLGVAFAALAVAAVAAAFIATRPVPTSEARRIAALLAQPAEHQTCVDAGIPVCAYAGDEALAKAYASAIRPVVAATPHIAIDGIALRQGADVDLEMLDPAIAARVPPDPWRGVPRLKMIAVSDAYDGARLHTALRFVGITDDDTNDEPIDVSGQARGVVAIWLATRGLDVQHATRLASVQSTSNGAPIGPWPDACFAGPAPVLWALTDLAAARQLIAADETTVRAVVHDRWAALVDPDTSTDALLDALGLAPLGPPSGRTPWPTAC